jgi:hypothetical protein
MKNIQLSSRKTDEVVIIALLCAIIPAFIGFCIEPPNLEFEQLRLFDATLCALLGVAFWGLYHLFGFDRMVGRKAIATFAATIVIWVLAITLLIVALHKVDSNFRSLEEATIIL